jgi:dTDP-4-dehydrorhamnose 3,5-epimerase
LFLPFGVAHGYCVLSEVADKTYQVTACHDGTDMTAVAWNDPDLAIPWPVSRPILSPRDRANPSFRELPLAAPR